MLPRGQRSVQDSQLNGNTNEWVPLTFGKRDWWGMRRGDLKRVGYLAQYELLERIGDGAYAEVRRARNPAFESNGLPEYLAVKVIDVTKVEGGIRAIENEVMAASSPSVTMPSLHDATLHPP